MSRRHSKASNGSTKESSKSSSKSRDSIISSDVRKLRQRMTDAVTESVEQSILKVCDEFKRALEKKQQRNGGVYPANGIDETEYDTYYRSCRRLVEYIADNMVTSSNFVQQMDRLIMACHSDASPSVLRRVVTKSIWFHGGASDMDDEEQEEDDEEEVEERQEYEEDDDEPHRTRRHARKPSSKKLSSASKVRVRRETRVETPSHTKRETRVETPSRASGKRRTRSSSSARRPQATPKRARRDARASSRRALPTSSGSEDENVTDDGREIKLKREYEPVGGQPHYAQVDERLNFKDAIGDLCYADRRTAAQTKFFKERLAKAIQYVDAQLCKPPPGKVCSRGCRNIRKQMCNRDLPCKNKLCRIWHDVEVHTDRCQNAHCEFRNRVMLRETMHKIDRKKLDLQNFRAESQKKAKELQEIKRQGDLNDREAYIESSLLENELTELKQEVERTEQELGMLKATRKAFWATLQDIDITIDDDNRDGFPEYHTHYTTKKTPVKKTRAAPSRQKQDDTLASPSACSMTRRGLRQFGAGPHGANSPAMEPTTTRSSPEPMDVDGDGEDQPLRRITRRSTQLSSQRLVGDVIEIEDDEPMNDDEEEEMKLPETPIHKMHYSEYKVAKREEDDLLKFQNAPVLSDGEHEEEAAEEEQVVEPTTQIVEAKSEEATVTDGTSEIDPKPEDLMVEQPPPATEPIDSTSTVDEPSVEPAVEPPVEPTTEPAPEAPLEEKDPVPTDEKENEAPSETPAIVPSAPITDAPVVEKDDSLLAKLLLPKSALTLKPMVTAELLTSQQHPVPIAPKPSSAQPDPAPTTPTTSAPTTPVPGFPTLISSKLPPYLASMLRSFQPPQPQPATTAVTAPPTEVAEPTSNPSTSTSTSTTAEATEASTATAPALQHCLEIAVYY